METFQTQWSFWQTGILFIRWLIPEGPTEAETAQVTNLTFQLEKGISQKSHFTRELLKALTPTQKYPQFEKPWKFLQNAPVTPLAFYDFCFQFHISKINDLQQYI